MGKFIEGALIAFILTALVAFVAFKTNVFKPGPNWSNPNETEFFDDASEQFCLSPVLNKSYNCAEDLLIDHQEIASSFEELIRFSEISNETVKNVTKILLQTKPTVTIRDVIWEYLTNKNVYDNIKPDAVVDHSADANTTTVIETTPIQSDVIVPANPTPVAGNNDENITNTSAPSTSNNNPE